MYNAQLMVDSLKVTKFCLQIKYNLLSKVRRIEADISTSTFCRVLSARRQPDVHKQLSNACFIALFHICADDFVVSCKVIWLQSSTLFINKTYIFFI